MKRSVYILIMAVAFAMVVGCTSESKPRKFKAGDYVKHKLEGRIGIVLDEKSWGTAEDPVCVVRFLAMQATTDTHFSAPDGAIQLSPFAEVRCHSFELEPAERPKPATLPEAVEKK